MPFRSLLFLYGSGFCAAETAECVEVLAAFIEDMPEVSEVSEDGESETPTCSDGCVSETICKVFTHSEPVDQQGFEAIACAKADVEAALSEECKQKCKSNIEKWLDASETFCKPPGRANLPNAVDDDEEEEENSTPTSPIPDTDIGSTGPCIGSDCGESDPNESTPNDACPPGTLNEACTCGNTPCGVGYTCQNDQCLCGDTGCSAEEKCEDNQCVATPTDLCGGSSCSPKETCDEGKCVAKVGDNPPEKPAPPVGIIVAGLAGGIALLAGIACVSKNYMEKNKEKERNKHHEELIKQSKEVARLRKEKEAKKAADQVTKSIAMPTTSMALKSLWNTRPRIHEPEPEPRDSSRSGRSVLSDPKQNPPGSNMTPSKRLMNIPDAPKQIRRNGTGLSGNAPARRDGRNIPSASRRALNVELLTSVSGA